MSEKTVYTDPKRRAWALVYAAVQELEKQPDQGLCLRAAALQNLIADRIKDETGK